MTADALSRLPIRGRPEHDVLAAALDAADEAGHSVPCKAPGAWRRFLSDDQHTRAGAAVECAACPALDPCAEAGRREHAGVWGGRARGPGTRTTTTNKETTQ